MIYKKSQSEKWAALLIYLSLLVLSLLCLLPIVHVFAVSLSSSVAVSTGDVVIWPVKLTFKSYLYVFSNHDFFLSMGVTLKRLCLGVSLNMLLTLLIAYPLSKENKFFQFRTFYAWYFVVTILFSGGLIPWYITIKNTGLMDTVWALVLPAAVPVFNVVLMINFFRGIPKELEESTHIDGAGHWTCLWRIYAPLSLPALATVTLLALVNHWNSWFDGLILMNHTYNYPLSSYLQTVVVQQNFKAVTLQSAEQMAAISDQTIKAAQIFVGMLPILLIYPFLQRFFIKGLVVGSVKQ